MKYEEKGVNEWSGMEKKGEGKVKQKRFGIRYIKRISNERNGMA